MAQAMKHAVKAGALAREAGRIPVREHAKHHRRRRVWSHGCKSLPYPGKSGPCTLLDRERTDRQRRLPGFDQDAVAAARVLVIGAGGLGCPVVQALAAAVWGICILSILIRWSCRISSVSRFLVCPDG